MQGIWVNGARPKTKTALRNAIAANRDVVIQATSFFGNEYDGALKDAPDGEYAIAGPDVYNLRNWYATITVARGKVSVT